VINLKLKANFKNKCPPFVTKLSNSKKSSDSISNYEVLINDVIEVNHSSGKFHIYLPQNDSLENDVILCSPSKDRVQRLIRANSLHNTLMITERCDQLCLMCSQPPRKTNDLWRFPFYKEALALAEENSTIVLSGGEPTLYKEQLFDLLNEVSDKRNDIKFHILTNCQHFEESDIPILKAIHNKISVLWGVPLYAHTASIHEEVVDKKDAFNTLLNNLYLLGSTGASIELRTVLTNLNALDLPNLAKFICRHINFINYWAIMAMEPVGYAKANLQNLLYDHSVAPQPLNKALNIAKIHDLNVKLFNFPLCTVNKEFRKHCVKSISDWKNKYLDICQECECKDSCTGFFEWYNQESAWSNISPITMECVS
jgi:His-Xaa-Ser system radical SAM maturase HxsC